MNASLRLMVLSTFLLALTACGPFGREAPPLEDAEATPTVAPVTSTLPPATPTAVPIVPTEEPTIVPTEEPFGYNAMDCTVTSQAAIPVCQAAVVACLNYYVVDVAQAAIEAAAAATECQVTRASECPDAVHLLNDNSWRAGMACIACPFYCACSEAEDGALYECGGESTFPEDPYPYRASSLSHLLGWRFEKPDSQATVRLR